MLQVHCKVDVGYIDEVRPMMFNSSSEQTPEGLQCADTAEYLRKGIKNYFKIVLVNNSNHDIFLRRNTVLGHLDYVSLVIPLEVKNVEIPSNKVPEKGAVSANNITSNLEQPQKLPEEHQQSVVKKIDLSGLTHEHREKARKSLREVKVMLKDMEKREIVENDLLYRRKIGDGKQLLLPKKLRPLVNVELQVLW